MAITKNRKTSTLLSFFLIITMCIGLIVISPVNASAEGEAKFLDRIDISGASVGSLVDVADDYYAYLLAEYDSTEEFYVSSAGQLAAIAMYVNAVDDFAGKTITLTDDINLGGVGLTITKTPLYPNPDDKYNLVITGTVTNAWTSIGSSEDNPFSGTFDGGGFEIKNMVVLEKASAENVYAGLFGYVASDATIQNVGIGEGSRVVASSSSSYAAAVAGGIAGGNYSGTITNCYNTGDVFSSSAAAAVAGGIAGYHYSGSITNCYNTGAVTSSSFFSSSPSNAGGIAGESYGAITNCYNTGDVSSVADTNNYAGGIVGYNRNTGAITGSFYDKEVTSGTDAGIHVPGLALSMAGSNYKTAEVDSDTLPIFNGDPVTDTWYFATVSTVLEENGIHPKLLSLLSYQIEVTANPAEGGTASANRQSSTKDFRVTLSAEASEGYRFVDWEVVSPAGLDITGDSFVMPSDNVQITANFKEIPPEPVVYEVLSVFPTYTGGNEISAKIDADSLTFEKLLLGGDEVDKSNYKIDNGSTIITLNNSYLSQFGDGTRVFRAVFTGGYADLTLVVALEQVTPPAQVIYPIIKDIPPFGGSGDASITIGADSSSFERLILNNKDVDKSNYTVTSGEGGTTVITLKESFLKIFPEGNFTFRAVFTGGYTDFTLKVDLGKTDDDKKSVDTKDSSKNVATGDNTPIGKLVGLIVLAGVVLTVLVLRKKIVKS